MWHPFGMVHSQMAVQFLRSAEMKVTNTALCSQEFTGLSVIHQAIPVALTYQLDQVWAKRLAHQVLGESLVQAQNARFFFFFTQKGIEIHVLVTWTHLTALAIKVNLKLSPCAKNLIAKSALG